MGGGLDSSAGVGGAVNQEGGLDGSADDTPLDCSDIDGATGDGSTEDATDGGGSTADATDGGSSTADAADDGSPVDGSLGDAALSQGLPVVNGYYAQKSSDGGIVYGGYLHTDNFGSNATVIPMCAGGPGCLNDNFCVSGTVPSGYTVGAVAMWNLNQAAVQDGGPPDAGPPSSLPADLTGKTKLVVRISGNYGLHPYVGLSADSNSYYTQIPTADGGGNGDLITIPLTSLTGYAFVDGGFVPIVFSTDKHPMYVYIQMFTDLVQSYSFNFCVTQLSIE